MYFTFGESEEGGGEEVELMREKTSKDLLRLGERATEGEEEEEEMEEKKRSCW